MHTYNIGNWMYSSVKNVEDNFTLIVIVNPHIKRHILEKHYTVIVTMLIQLNKQRDRNSGILIVHKCYSFVTCK